MVPTSFLFIVARVFVDESGNFGDTVGVLIDENRELSVQRRQEIATSSGYDEVVFINDIQTRDISIYQPQNEISFAGTAALAAAGFFLQNDPNPRNHLICQQNVIPLSVENNILWVTAPLSLMPPWNIVNVVDAVRLEQMTAESEKKAEHTVFWQWQNEKEGLIRAKTFASDWDVPESEANGSGALLLATKQGRQITVVHGKGSVIYASPLSREEGKIGGRVVLLSSSVR